MKGRPQPVADAPRTAPFLEVELKLALPASQCERLKRHPALRAVSPHRAVLADLDAVYFDTPDLALQSHGMAVRLREAGGNWVQTVKTRGDASGGLHQRLEWESPSDGVHLDFSDISDDGVRSTLENPTLRPRLQAAFRTRFRRWARLLVFPDGTQIELALDQGEILAGTRSVPISELELELKAGHPAALFRFALTLLADLDLQPEQRSKAERGYALAQDTQAPAQRAAPPRLTRTMPCRAACAAFLTAAQQQWLANRLGAMAGEDPAFLHQARVGLRRLRATLSVFRAAIPADTLALLREELRWLMQSLGPARDWDVFVGETLPLVAADATTEAGLAEVRLLALQARQVARRAAATSLDSRRAAACALRIGLLACELAQPEGNEEPLGPGALPARDALDAGNQRLDGFARRLLRKRGRTALLGAEELLALDVDGRHAWRITLKKLRYTSDFLLGVVGRRSRARRWVNALTSVQDILGSMNDAASTHHLLSQLPTQSTAGREAQAMLRGFVNGVSHARLTQLEMARAMLAATDRPWKR